jgi:hypothetical protein
MIGGTISPGKYDVCRGLFYASGALAFKQEMKYVMCIFSCSCAYQKDTQGEKRPSSITSVLSTKWE